MNLKLFIGQFNKNYLYMIDSVSTNYINFIKKRYAKLVIHYELFLS